jgi:hypothetical protein
MREALRAERFSVQIAGKIRPRPACEGEGGMRRPAEVVLFRLVRSATVGRAVATRSNRRYLPQLVLENAPKLA